MAVKIGFIGAGWPGAAAGKAWVEAGHQVLFPSRRSEKQAGAATALGPLACGGAAQAEGVAQAAARLPPGLHLVGAFSAVDATAIEALA